MKFEIENISKIYNNRIIFNGLSRTFHPGRSYVVAGPNGSGKTTLLRILCGLLRPTSGKVLMEIDGKEFNSCYERGKFIGYISSDLNLYDRLSAFENLLFFAYVKGLMLSHAHIFDLLQEVQLKDYAHITPGAYSSGMRQRLKLAYALIHRPSILLLDEPTTNLDDRGREMVEKIINKQREKGIVIIASNEPEEVEKYGQEIIFLDS